MRMGGLEEEPTALFGAHAVCTCCGVQYEYDVIEDADIEAYRNGWLQTDAAWFVVDTTLAGWVSRAARAQIATIEDR